jgi:hypothetical protein
MRSARQIAPLAAVVLGVLAPGAAHALAAPSVEQLVVFRDGTAKAGSVGAGKTTVKVGRRRCAVGSGTPLAALARSRVAKLRLHDYGSCSRRTGDAAGLYVRSIGRDVAKGQNGWVYKVGQKLAPAGAADPAGPFGNGRLRTGARVTWFYCRYDQRVHGCQRTLGVTVAAPGGGVLQVTVKAYDDQARAVPAAGATVHAGGATGTTDANGNSTLTVPAGTYAVFAEGAGAVRSQPVSARVG